MQENMLNVENENQKDLLKLTLKLVVRILLTTVIAILNTFIFKINNINMKIFLVFTITYIIILLFTKIFYSNEYIVDILIDVNFSFVNGILISTIIDFSDVLRVLFSIAIVTCIFICISYILSIEGKKKYVLLGAFITNMFASAGIFLKSAVFDSYKIISLNMLILYVVRVVLLVVCSLFIGHYYNFEVKARKLNREDITYFYYIFLLGFMSILEFR